MPLALVLGLAALAGPLTVLMVIALAHPRYVLAFVGRGQGTELGNAVRGMRVALGLALFGSAFAAGALTAFMSRISTP